MPVSFDNSATDRLSGGIIRFNTVCFNSSANTSTSLVTFRLPLAPEITEISDNYSDAGG